MRKLLVTSCVLIALAGCNAQSERYVKSGVSEQEFLKDRLECLKEVTPVLSSAQFIASTSPFGPSSSAKPNCAMFQSCLGAKGYMTTPDGPLEVPANMRVRCK